MISNFQINNFEFPILNSETLKQAIGEERRNWWVNWLTLTRGERWLWIREKPAEEWELRRGWVGKKRRDERNSLATDTFSPTTTNKWMICSWVLQSNQI